MAVPSGGLGGCTNRCKLEMQGNFCKVLMRSGLSDSPATLDQLPVAEICGAKMGLEIGL